jgi:hypothetical protein
MAAGLVAKLEAPTVSMMLLMMTALLPAVLTRMPKFWPRLVSEKPSMVTFAAWTVITPVTVDSEGLPKVRPAKAVPACAPLRVSVLGMVTFSGYAPEATLMGSQLGSSTAS